MFMYLPAPDGVVVVDIVFDVASVPLLPVVAAVAFVPLLPGVAFVSEQNNVTKLLFNEMRNITQYFIHPGGKLKLSFDLIVKHNPKMNCTYIAY